MFFSWKVGDGVNFYRFADYSFVIQHGSKAYKFNAFGLFEKEVQSTHYALGNGLIVDCIGVLNQKKSLMYTLVNNTGTKLKPTMSTEELDILLRSNNGFITKGVIQLEEGVTYSLYILRQGFL